MAEDTPTDEMAADEMPADEMPAAEMPAIEMIDEIEDEDTAAGPRPAPIDEPLDDVPPATAPGGDRLEVEADGTGVAEALRAWAAGGHSIGGDEAGDEILPVQFAQLEEPPPQKVRPRYQRINNVLVEITVELGRKELSVRELTNLKVQDVIDLDKLAGEAFDILINKRPFAEGEIVVVTDLMAVRITRLIDRTPQEEDEE